MIDEADFQGRLVRDNPWEILFANTFNMEVTGVRYAEQSSEENIMSRLSKEKIKIVMKSFAVLAMFTTSITFSGLIYAETESSDWIELAPGFEEKKIGARVESVGEADQEGLVRIEVSIPDPRDRDIEEVIITARKRKPGKKMEYHVDAEVIKDLEAGRTGIIFYLGQEEDFQLRLNYIDYTKNPALAPGS